MLAYALRRSASHADAQDAVAETFAVAWRRLEDVPDHEGSILWLYGVARRVLANQRRAQHRRDELSTRLSLVSQDPGRLGPETGDDVRSVLATVARLDPKDREILLLAAWEGLSHAEIAVVLGCSENASAIRLHRARQRLQRIFAKETAPSGQ